MLKVSSLMAVSVVAATQVTLFNPAYIESQPSDRRSYTARLDVGRELSLPAYSGGNSIDLCNLVTTAAKRADDAAKGTAECTLFSSSGQVLTSTSGIEDGAELYVVPKGSLFVWPALEVGHRHKLMDIGDVSGHGEVELETISVEPRIFRLHNFLSQEEVDNLVDRAKSQDLSRSTGGLQKKGNKGENQGDINPTRTSLNSWDIRSDMAIKLKKRSFDVLRVPWQKNWADGFQIVNYEAGQFYNTHTDFFGLGTTRDWNWDPSSGGINRFATVFVYLSDAELGGETMFPLAGKIPEDGATSEIAYKMRDQLVANGTIAKDGLEYNIIKECRESFHVKPKRGDAIIFYHQDSRGILDNKAKHAACPVLQGEKWGANLWIWNGEVWSHQEVERKAKWNKYMAHQMFQVSKLPHQEVTFVNSYDAEQLEIVWVRVPKQKRSMVSVGFIAPGGSLSLSAPLGGIYISHIVVSQASQKVPLKKLVIKTGVLEYEASKKVIKDEL